MAMYKRQTQFQEPIDRWINYLACLVVGICLGAVVVSYDVTHKTGLFVRVHTSGQPYAAVGEAGEASSGNTLQTLPVKQF